MNKSKHMVSLTPDEHFGNHLHDLKKWEAEQAREKRCIHCDRELAEKIKNYCKDNTYILIGDMKYDKE